MLLEKLKKNYASKQYLHSNYLLYCDLHMIYDGEALLNDGGAEQNRTVDLLIANEALSQLSYSPQQLTLIFTQKFCYVKKLGKMS